MTTATAPTAREHKAGVFIELRSFPACRVWVSEQEITRAMSNGRHTFNRKRTAINIAIGKRCGTYPVKPGEIREWKPAETAPEPRPTVVDHDELQDARDDCRALALEGRA